MGRGQATQASNTQTLRKTVNVSQFTKEKVKKKKKKLMANAEIKLLWIFIDCGVKN